MRKFNYHCTALLCILIACSTIACASDHTKNEIVQADMVLCFSSLDEIDIGISKGSGEHTIRKLFRRDQLEAFFEEERRKELVVACYPDGFKSKEEARKFLKSLNYKRIFEYVGEPKAAFEIRCNAERKFPPNEADAQYHHTREIHVMKSLNEIEVNIGTLSPPEKDGGQTYRVFTPISFSKDEIHSFLKQDTQRGYLLVHWSKFYYRKDGSKIEDENALRTLAKDSKFVSTKFEQDYGMFQVEPTIIER